MKVIRFAQSGPASVLTIAPAQEPEPKADEIKIKIKASGLNHLDIWIREGKVKVPSLPWIPGCDAAGVVVEVDSHVKTFKTGDRVFVIPGVSCGECDFCRQKMENYCATFQIRGALIPGSHQEYLCVPENQAVDLPANLGFNEGAAFPLTFLTAWHMLATRAHIQKNETVLIMAGASGLGCAAIQIAKLLGARVITTVGDASRTEALKDLGAHEVINHYQENIQEKIMKQTKNCGVNVIFDHVGAKVWPTLLTSLAKGGRMVFCGTTTGGDVALNLRHIFSRQQTLMGCTMGNSQDLHEVTRHVASGALKPLVHKVFPFTEVQQAHQMLENGGIFGKIILQWEK